MQQITEVKPDNFKYWYRDINNNWLWIVSQNCQTNSKSSCLKFFHGRPINITQLEKVKQNF